MTVKEIRYSMTIHNKMFKIRSFLKSIGFYVIEERRLTKYCLLTQVSPKENNSYMRSTRIIRILNYLDNFCSSKLFETSKNKI